MKTKPLCIFAAVKSGFISKTFEKSFKANLARPSARKTVPLLKYVK